MLYINEILEEIKIKDRGNYELIQKINLTTGQPYSEIIIKCVAENKEALKKLREKHPILFLKPEEIHKLEEIIIGSDDYRGFLANKGLFNSNDEQSVLEHYAKKIYEQMTPEQKNLYKLNEVQAIISRMPVMNLGVITSSQGNSIMDFPNYFKNNIEFFKDNRNIATRLFLRYFMQKGEMRGKDLDGYLTQVESEMKKIGAYDL